MGDSATTATKLGARGTVNSVKLIMQYLRYKCGNEIRIGDIVEIAGMRGEVVCILDESRATEEFPAAEWAYLKKGLLIETEEIGLVHTEDITVDLRLIAHQNA